MFGVCLRQGTYTHTQIYTYTHTHTYAEAQTEIHCYSSCWTDSIIIIMRPTVKINNHGWVLFHSEFVNRRAHLQR